MKQYTMTANMIDALTAANLTKRWEKAGMTRLYIDLGAADEMYFDRDDTEHGRLPLNRRERDNAKVWIDLADNTISCKGCDDDVVECIVELAGLLAAPEEDEQEEDNDEPHIWYAVLIDADDTDWGVGSHDIDEAMDMVRTLRADGHSDAYIAEIEEGDDPICCGEIRDI